MEETENVKWCVFKVPQYIFKDIALLLAGRICKLSNLNMHALEINENAENQGGILTKVLLFLLIIALEQKT